jgi:hypothetical protein
MVVCASTGTTISIVSWSVSTPDLDASVDERIEESLEVSGLWLWHA